MNVFFVLRDAARAWAGETAVVHEGRHFCYAELHAAAEAMAENLRKTGVRAGDKVAILCPNSPEYIVAAFAIFHVGAIVVPIPPGLKAAEIVNLSEEMQLDAFCSSVCLQPLVPDGDKSATTEASVFEGREPLTIRVSANRKTSQNERAELIRMGAATIRFTSGTTSAAKGIILSHATLSEWVNSQSASVPRLKNDRVLWLQSMRQRGLTGLYVYLLRGARIIMADSVNTQQLQLLFGEHRFTHIDATPLFYQMMLNQKGIAARDLDQVKYFFCTGSSLPASLAEAFRARFGHEVVQYYGLGECGLVMVNLSDDARKRGSVGKPVGRYEIKLLSEKPDLCGDEAVGELLIRGPCLFDAYYRPWRLREEVLEDGWFRTGDVARRDADGYYWIVGRVKDVINVGGMKVFPSEIEEVLLTHPAVEEAVVYGVAEGRFGEVPHARVKLRAGATCAERELLRHVNEKVSVFKALRGVEFVKEIPKTVTGKPRRTVVES